MPIRDKVEQNAASMPEKIAFQVAGQSRTYGELAERSRLFSAYVRSLPGRRKSLPLLNRVGKVVALDLGNDLLFPELFIGATERPIACAVLDPKMLPAQIEDIFARLQPDLVVTASAGSATADIASRMGLFVLSGEEISKGIPECPDEDATDLSDFDDDTFLINFTSGTTSQPKAYSRSRISWRNSLQRGRDLFGLKSGPTAFCPGALAHGLALYALVETLHSGGTFHTVPKWDANDVAQILANSGVQRLIAVPTMISALAKEISGQSPAFPSIPAFSSIKEVLTAGAKLNHTHVELMVRLFPAARIREYYGASELGFVSVSTVHPTDQATPLTSVGQAFPGVEISIRDPENGRLGPDTPGTIYVKSDLISDGYLWGDDGKAFRANATGATVGDIGELSGGGALKVLGREGGMVITGGFNVYPSEVEEVLKTIAGIEEAVVIGVDDSHLGKRLVAVLCGDFKRLETVLQQLGKGLPRYKIPREFYRAESWPKTSSGKIARRQVEDFLREGGYKHV